MASPSVISWDIHHLSMRAGSFSSLPVSCDPPWLPGRQQHLGVHPEPIVFSLVPSFQEARLQDTPLLCLTRHRSCLSFPCPSRVKASIVAPGSVLPTALCCLRNCLSPSIYTNLHIYYSGSHLYIMQAHYPSFICICIIHASSHLLSSTSLATSFMWCFLSSGVNTVRPASPKRQRTKGHGGTWREQRGHTGEWLREPGEGGAWSLEESGKTWSCIR